MQAPHAPDLDAAVAAVKASYDRAVAEPGAAALPRVAPMLDPLRPFLAPRNLEAVNRALLAHGVLVETKRVIDLADDPETLLRHLHFQVALRLVVAPLLSGRRPPTDAQSAPTRSRRRSSTASSTSSTPSATSSTRSAGRRSRTTTRSASRRCSRAAARRARTSRRRSSRGATRTS